MSEHEGGYVPEEAKPQKKLVESGFGPAGTEQLAKFQQWCAAEKITAPSDTSVRRGDRDQLMLAYLDASKDVAPIVTNERLARLPDVQKQLRASLEAGDADLSRAAIGQLRRMLDKIEQGINATEQ